MKSPAQYLLVLLTACFFLAGGSQLLAQVEQCAGIRPVDANLVDQSPYIHLRILARDAECRPVGILKRENIQVFETIEGKETTPVEIKFIFPEAIYDSVNFQKDTVEVLFLVDISKNSTSADVDRAKSLITNFLSNYPLGPNARYRLCPFAESIIQARDLPAAEIPSALIGLEATDQPADLYPILISQLREMSVRPGRKLIFLLSNGMSDDSLLTRYDKNLLPPDPSDVERVVRSLDGYHYFFPIILGDTDGESAKLLERLTEASQQPADEVTQGRLPQNLSSVLSSSARLIATHRLEIVPSVKTFKGENRTYSLQETGRPESLHAIAPISEGSDLNPETLGEPLEAFDFLGPSLVGLAGVLGLLGIFAFVFPVMSRRRFERQHVSNYIPTPGRSVMDPLTREPIPAGEPVVTVCKQTVAFRTWKDCGNQCPHYPRCTSNNLQCKGEGAPENNYFFGLQGKNRRLNWIWFGAVGGFLGWLFYTLLTTLGEGLTTNLNASAQRALSGLSGQASNVNAEALVSDALVGICFGIGLTLLLAIMEERTQSRRRSNGRILLRTLLGGIVAMLAFGGSFFLRSNGLIPNGLLATGLAWMLFGTGLGMVLSINSSIALSRGILGGLLAGLTGFIIFYLLSNIVGNSLLAKTVSFLVSGALLGWVLDTVVKMAETYEMEYLSPANYRRNVPLSKWLKSGWDIFIGTQPGSQVYVKWPDESVQPEHAKLIMDGGRVYLIPLAETLVNGKIINEQKRTQLQDGDTIQLGRRAITQMRFHAKQTVVE